MGTVLDGNRHWNICMRRHAWEIVRGVQKQQSVADLVPTAAWVLYTLSVVNTTNLSYHFQIGWGKHVMYTRVRRVKAHKMPGDMRNQFDICVGHSRA